MTPIVIASDPSALYKVARGSEAISEIASALYTLKRVEGAMTGRSTLAPGDGQEGVRYEVTGITHPLS